MSVPSLHEVTETGFGELSFVIFVAGVEHFLHLLSAVVRLIASCKISLLLVRKTSDPLGSLSSQCFNLLQTILLQQAHHLFVGFLEVLAVHLPAFGGELAAPNIVIFGQSI